MGTWTLPVDGREMRVNPADIRKVALFCIEGELDDISGVGQTSAALELCSGLPESMKEHLIAEGAGHYGIFSGRRWRDIICPRIGEFIRRND
jgi:poly(3-hydroxybutyrate) depolymerase